MNEENALEWRQISNSLKGNVYIPTSWTVSLMPKCQYQHTDRVVRVHSYGRRKWQYTDNTTSEYFVKIKDNVASLISMVSVAGLRRWLILTTYNILISQTGTWYQSCPGSCIPQKIAAKFFIPFPAWMKINGTHDITQLWTCSGPRKYCAVVGSVLGGVHTTLQSTTLNILLLKWSWCYVVPISFLVNFAHTLTRTFNFLKIPLTHGIVYKWQGSFHGIIIRTRTNERWK